MRDTLAGIKTPWSFWLVVKIFVLTIVLPSLVLIAVLLVLMLVNTVLGSDLQLNESATGMLVTVLFLSCELGLLAWLMRRYKVGLGDLGVVKLPILHTIGYVVAALALQIGLITLAFYAIVVLVPAVNINEPQEVGLEFGSAGIGLWISFFVTVIVTPLVEELYFRGLLLPVVAKKFGLIAGILLSSVFFALLHGQVNVMIYTFVLGVILSILYLRSRSIVPGIIVHTVNNAIAFAVLVGLIQ